ncbi:MAG: hypothetical protein IKI33_05775 [Eubacterium sp.]|nr:hypothetical protein [Eubacterium sp.]
MIAFEMLTPLIRAFFALWALLLCLTNIGSAVLAAVKKRLCFALCAVFLFVPAYSLWQVIFDFSLFGSAEQASKLTKTLCVFPWTYWLSAFVILTLTSALLLALNIRYDKTFLTSGAIKTYLDKIPCGVCCWRENGRVLFSNICMNELCVSVTRNSLLNGNHFKNAVKDGIINVDGKVWRFTSRDIFIDGERLYEMIASDVTSEYAKTQALEKDKAELSRLNTELKEYYLSIDESVKRQEVLQAKMNIHDEMNRLMLLTAAADKNDAAALNGIFTLWEQNALLLCKEADKKTAQQSEDIDMLAAKLGVSLTWRETLPDTLSEKQKELFFLTANEALVNAVKHAQASSAEISFEEKENTLICRFKNDGNPPKDEVSFEGGLANIALIAREQGAELYTELGGEFTLVLKFHPFG